MISRSGVHSANSHRASQCPSHSARTKGSALAGVSAIPTTSLKTPWCLLSSSQVPRTGTEQGDRPQLLSPGEPFLLLHCLKHRAEGGWVQASSEYQGINQEPRASPLWVQDAPSIACSGTIRYKGVSWLSRTFQDLLNRKQGHHICKGQWGGQVRGG